MNFWPGFWFGVLCTFAVSTVVTLIMLFLHEVGLLGSREPHSRVPQGQGGRLEE